MADITVTMTTQKADEYSGAISDILCWLRGFQAAHHGREDGPPMPPEWSTLRDLNIEIKKALQKELWK